MFWEAGIFGFDGPNFNIRFHLGDERFVEAYSSHNFIRQSKLKNSEK
jgi:hypothetical protein